METNGDGRPLNKPGLYKQKETGAEVVLEETPGLGTPVIDAFIQAGFVRIGDAPEKSKVVPETESSKK